MEENSTSDNNEICGLRISELWCVYDETKTLMMMNTSMIRTTTSESVSRPGMTSHPLSEQTWPLSINGDADRMNMM